MVKEIIYCDRCGKECESFRCNHGLHLFRNKFLLKTSNDENLHLCAKCYDSLAEWMKNKKTAIKRRTI